MNIRPCESNDHARLKTLFDMQGFDYQLPSLREFVAAQGVEDGDLVMAILARPTTELYMLADPNWRTPQWRFDALKKLHESMRLELRGKGFSDAHVFLPPEKQKSFGRRLMRDFNWSEPLWKCYCRSTEAIRKAG